MKIGRVDVCDHCGAAYTPHVVDCPRFGEPAPMEAPHLPPVDPDGQRALELEANEFARGR